MRLTLLWVLRRNAGLLDTTTKGMSQIAFNIRVKPTLQPSTTGQPSVITSRLTSISTGTRRVLGILLGVDTVRFFKRCIYHYYGNTNDVITTVHMSLNLRLMEIQLIQAQLLQHLNRSIISSGILTLRIHQTFQLLRMSGVYSSKESRSGDVPLMKSLNGVFNMNGRGSRMMK
jgi:hypothetical protein